MSAVYGLLGYPLSHSFSKGYFTQKFTRENTSASYLNFELPSIEEFKNLIDSEPNLRGLNVTIPYKQAVLPFLHELDREAAEIGAVNVIRFDSADGVRLIGYNTDVLGFRESIRPLVEELRKRLENQDSVRHPLQALVFGTGGASKAIVYGLKQLGIHPVLVSRKHSADCLSYDQLSSEDYQRFRVLVNTTPLGMYPNTDACPPLDYSQIGSGHLLFDAVYNPDKTLFLQKGEAAGALIKNGLEMLHLQAEAAWNIWNETSF